MPRPAGLPKTGGRQKGSVNKITADVKAIAGQYTDEAIATLASIMKDGEEAAPARVAAAKELLDRGHGKARQAVDVDANVTAQISEIRHTIVDPERSDG